MAELEKKPADTRSFGTLVKQFRQIEAIKTRLIREGFLNGDARTSDVEDCLRGMIPVEVFDRRQSRIAEHPANGKA